MTAKVKRIAVLRTCASCEWIFKMADNDSTCPKCKFISYGARYAYGDKAYTYAKNQRPWKDKKMFSYELKLDEEIRKDMRQQTSVRFMKIMTRLKTP